MHRQWQSEREWISILRNEIVETQANDCVKERRPSNFKWQSEQEDRRTAHVTMEELSQPFDRPWRTIEPSFPSQDLLAINKKEQSELGFGLS